jgi:hypothetical protein
MEGRLYLVLAVLAVVEAAVLQHIPLVEEWAEMVALALLFFA